jgi:hypothetical protein
MVPWVSHGGWEQIANNEELAFVLGLRKTDWGFALFPFAALFKKLHALETFKDGAFAANGGV